MWKLFKTETLYNLRLSLGTGAYILFIFFVLHIKDRGPITLPFALLLSLMVIATLFFHFSDQLTRHQEKRERKLRLTPMLPQTVWLVRLLHLLLFWLGLVILSVLMAAVSPYLSLSTPVFIPVLSITGVVVALHGLLYCLGDLPMTVSPAAKVLGMPVSVLLSVFKYIAYIITAALAALLFAGNIIAMMGNFKWLLPNISAWLVNSGTGALSCWMLGAAAVFLGNRVYRNRKSFA